MRHLILNAHVGEVHCQILHQLRNAHVNQKIDVSTINTFVQVCAQLLRTYYTLQKLDKDKAVAAYKEAVPAIDTSVSKGIIHKNTAARSKSRLNAKLQAM